MIHPNDVIGLSNDQIDKLNMPGISYNWVQIICQCCHRYETRLNIILPMFESYGSQKL